MGVPAAFRRLLESSAPRAVALIRLAVAIVFVSEGIQKFVYPAALGAGRFRQDRHSGSRDDGALHRGDREPARYGPGDVELGAKFRFVEEGDRRPQVGTFPLVLLPTGSATRGLGAGKTRVLLPIWVQKSIGRWTTYGGGGVQLAAGERDGVAGWLVQRELGETVILGGETFLSVPFGSEGAEVRINLGAVVNFTSNHHLLVSAGPAFGGDARAQAYAAYQLTI